MFALGIMHYTIYTKYLVIHYIIYHFEFLFIYLKINKSKEDKMQIESLLLIVRFLN
jgi:hypothetical protein